MVTEDPLETDNSGVCANKLEDTATINTVIFFMTIIKLVSKRKFSYLFFILNTNDSYKAVFIILKCKKWCTLVSFIY
jgi:hypothetical protein